MSCNPVYNLPTANKRSYGINSFPFVPYCTEHPLKLCLSLCLPWRSIGVETKPS